MKQEDLLKSKVSVDNLIDLQESMEKAEHDDTPFPVVTDDGVNVVGDANKTQVKTRNYSIRFRFPKEREQDFDEKDIIQRVGDYIIVSVDFDDVHIVPRRDTEIVTAIVRILPYIKEMNEDGSIRPKTNSEMLEMVRRVNKDIGDDIYNVVAAVLNVDDSLKDYMLFDDVMDMLTKLPDDFPEAFNEADGFFG